VRKALVRNKGCRAAISAWSRKAVQYRFSERYPTTRRSLLAGTTAAAVPHVRSGSNNLSVRYPGGVQARAGWNKAESDVSAAIPAVGGMNIKSLVKVAVLDDYQSRHPSPMP
jgi:hypothetical protein